MNMSEYEDKLNIALANITDVRNKIIQQIETEYQKRKTKRIKNLPTNRLQNRTTRPETKITKHDKKLA